MKRILLATAACLALSLPAMAQNTANQPNPTPQNQNQQQMKANQPAQGTNMQSSQANPAPQAGNNQQAQIIQPTSLSKEQVRELQMSLNKDGFSSGRVDGIWGSDTRDAVMNYQKMKNLPGAGELNQQTLATLGVNMSAQNNQQAQVIQPSSLSKEQVRDIQMSLNKDGFSSGHVDGIWGSDTRDAVMNYQKMKNLPGAGELNQQTLAALGVNLNKQSATTGSGQANSGAAMNGSAPNGNSNGQTATTSNHAGSMNNTAGSNPSNTKP